MLRVISGLPWPVMALIAAGFFWLAQNSREWVAEHEAEKAQALEQGVPAPVPLDQFTAADVGLVDEVHVTAWINPAHNYELTKERKGPDTVRRMFVLFGPGDGPESTVARGVVVVPPDAMQSLIDLMAAHVADPDDPRMLFNLNGAKESSPDLSSMVNDALAERGLTKDADFLAIAPYFEGREVALAPNPDAPMFNFMVIGGIGLVTALLALVKFMAARRARARRREVEAALEVQPHVAAAFELAATRSATPMAGTSGGARPEAAASGSGTWSPLEAVRAKQALRDGAGAGVMRSDGVGHVPGPATGLPSGMGLGSSLPKRDDAGEGGLRLLRVPTKVVGALALYFVIYLSFGHLTPSSTMNGIPEGGIAEKLMGEILGFDMAEMDANWDPTVVASTDEAPQAAPVTPVPEAAPVVSTAADPAATPIPEEKAVGAGEELAAEADAERLPLSAMMEGIADFEVGSDPFVFGQEQVDAEQLSMPGVHGNVMPGGDLPADAGSTVPMPEGIAGLEQPLPQIVDPPAPADQVQEDIAAGMTPAEAIRKAIVAEFPEEETKPKFLRPGDGDTDAGLGQMLRDLIPQSWSGIFPTPDGVSAPVTESAGPDLPLPLPLLVAVVAAVAAGLLLMVMAVRLLLSGRAVAPGAGARMRGDPWDRLSDRLR